MHLYMLNFKVFLLSAYYLFPQITFSISPQDTKLQL